MRSTKDGKSVVQETSSGENLEFPDTTSYLFIDEEEPISEKEEPLFDVNSLKLLKDYEEALNGKGEVIVGRQKELLAFYKSKDYLGKILYPEGRGDMWSLEKNAAFWAGGMQANRNFKIVTPIKSILIRMKQGVKQSNLEGTLGGVTQELLWLEDNGYHFQPDPKNTKHTLAIAPTKLETLKLNKTYGNVLFESGKSQCNRIEKICKDVENAKNLCQNKSHSKKSSRKSVEFFRRSEKKSTKTFVPKRKSEP